MNIRTCVRACVCVCVCVWCVRVCVYIPAPGSVGMQTCLYTSKHMYMNKTAHMQTSAAQTTVIHFAACCMAVAEVATCEARLEESISSPSQKSLPTKAVHAVPCEPAREIPYHEHTPPHAGSPFNLERSARVGCTVSEITGEGRGKREIRLKSVCWRNETPRIVSTLQ